MKNRLIALRGQSHFGKSTTLHMLYRILILDPTTKTISYKVVGRKLDFEAILKVRDYKVGIVNRGDVAATLIKRIRALGKAGCAIIVCAARTKGKVDGILASFDPPYQLVMVIKTRSKNASQEVSNLGFAYGLAAEVYAAIDA